MNTKKGEGKSFVFNKPWLVPVCMVIPLLFILIVFYFYPMIKLVPQSFLVDGSFSFGNYATAFTNPVYTKALGTTILVGVGAVALTFVLGYPVAFLMNSIKEKYANILMAFIMITFWTSLMVRTYSWMVVLQKNGILNSILLNIGIIKDPLNLLYTPFAITIGTVHILLPYMILPVNSILKGIDKNLAWAARSMGASKLKAFWLITFPLSIPGVAAGVLLVFVQAIGFYVTPMLLGGGKTMILSTLVDKQMFTFVNWGLGSALGIVLMVISIVFLIIFTRIFGTKSLKNGLF